MLIIAGVLIGCCTLATSPSQADASLRHSSVPAVRLAQDFVVDFNGSVAARHPVALTYLSNGFSWAADYVGRVNQNDDRIDVDAFITLHNDTGISFDNATSR